VMASVMDAIIVYKWLLQSTSEVIEIAESLGALFIACSLAILGI